MGAGSSLSQKSALATQSTLQRLERQLQDAPVWQEGLRNPWILREPQLGGQAWPGTEPGLWEGLTPSRGAVQLHSVASSPGFGGSGVNPLDVVTLRKTHMCHGH